MSYIPHYLMDSTHAYLMEREAREQLDEALDLEGEDSVHIFLLNLPSPPPLPSCCPLHSSCSITGSGLQVMRCHLHQRVELPDSLQRRGLGAQHDTLGALHERLKVLEELGSVGRGEGQDLRGREGGYKKRSKVLSVLDIHTSMSIPNLDEI